MLENNQINVTTYIEYIRKIDYIIDNTKHEKGAVKNILHNINVWYILYRPFKCNLAERLKTWGSSSEHICFAFCFAAECKIRENAQISAFENVDISLF